MSKTSRLSACSIQQLASLLLFGERAGEQILQKERTQGFNSRRSEAGKKAVSPPSARAVFADRTKP
jgi:hypothetical protein